MPKVNLPYLNEGKEFDVVVYIEDVEKYEQAEAKAAKDGLKPSAMFRARLEWLQHVLGQSPAYVAPKDGVLRLQTQQINEAFWSVWQATANGQAPDPLE